MCSYCQLPPQGGVEYIAAAQVDGPETYEEHLVKRARKWDVSLSERVGRVDPARDPAQGIQVATFEAVPHLSEALAQPVLRRLVHGGDRLKKTLRLDE